MREYWLGGEMRNSSCHSRHFQCGLRCPSPQASSESIAMRMVGCIWITALRTDFLEIPIQRLSGVSPTTPATIQPTHRSATTLTTRTPKDTSVVDTYSLECFECPFYLTSIINLQTIFKVPKDSPKNQRLCSPTPKEHEWRNQLHSKKS